MLRFVRKDCSRICGIFRSGGLLCDSKCGLGDGRSGLACLFVFSVARSSKVQPLMSIWINLRNVNARVCRYGAEPE